MVSLSTISQLRNRHFLIGDLILLPAMIIGSFLLLLDPHAFLAVWPTAILLASIAIILTPLIFATAGLYSRYWPYASVEELLVLFFAVCVLTIVISAGHLAITTLFSDHFAAAPHSILAIFFLLALPAAVTPRLMVRLLATVQPRHASQVQRERALIVGAGEAGVIVLRELRRDPHLGIDVIGFLDDDPRKQRVRIQGTLVLGTRHDLCAVANHYPIARVIIALPRVPGQVIREVYQDCEKIGARAQTIPSLARLIDGTIGIQHLRDVDIEDLLRREPIQTDLTAVGDLLHGKRILITGAGGSIGSELARQVLRSRPRDLVLLGHGENSIFAIHNELARLQRDDATFDATALHPVIADIRFPHRLRDVFNEYRPEIVFHAAAHKHVPLMEANPSEAILNNVTGTRNVLDAALQFDVDRFVLISTDKAVNPTSIMGASKRVAELLVHQAAHRNRRPYMVIRFGNVLGSRGSVVPTMKQQIALGGPVTVTHPEITRYFITIPEAVQLVLQAGVIGHGGEVFVLDMGEPVKIIDMARDLIRLSGLEIGHDIDIAITGLRPGEKLYEELFIPGENYRRTSHHKIFIADNASHLVPTSIEDTLVRLEAAARRNDSPAIWRELRSFLPEFAQLMPDPRPAMLGQRELASPLQVNAGDD